MKKQYVNAEIEVIRFQQNNVIETSGDLNFDTNDRNTLNYVVFE